MDMFSTIAAISTPYGTGGISIVRISGPDAIKISDKVFFSPSGKALKDCESHTIHYGHIKDSKGKKIDQVLVSLMKAPRTFTGEDTVEINCHGGIVVTNKVLSEVLKNGAIMADRGEFTKRAFLNGKIDLCEAESVIDIINSKTALQHQISVNNLGGALSGKINSLRERLIGLCANIQVLIDYPDKTLESDFKRCVFVFDDDHALRIEKVEDEHFVSVRHDMTKQHYISFLAFVTGDRLQFVKLYPEGNAETRLHLRGSGFLYGYCNRHGLMKQKI